MSFSSAINCLTNVIGVINCFVNVIGAMNSYVIRLLYVALSSKNVVLFYFMCVCSVLQRRSGRGCLVAL